MSGKRSVIARVLRHPLRSTSFINRSNVKAFFSTVHYSGFRTAVSITKHVVNNAMANAKRLENLDVYTAGISNSPEDVELPSYDAPLVSVIIPVYNQYNFTMACLKSIAEHTSNVPYEVIIGDDCSTDGTVDIRKHVKNVTVVRNATNLGFILNCNNAASHARGKYLHFLNNDTIVTDGWLRFMVDLMESNDDVGIVGSKLVYPDGTLQEAGGIIWCDGTAYNYGKGSNPNDCTYNYVKEVDYVTGASLLIPKSLFDRIGGFDPLYAPAYYEDSDLAFSVRSLGYRVMYQPLSVVIHFEGMTHGRTPRKTSNKYQEANILKFRSKWAKELKEQLPPGKDLFHARDRSKGKKTVLLVTNHLPSDDLDSGSRRIVCYLRTLTSAGYSVKLASKDFYYDQTNVQPLQNPGVEVYYGSELHIRWKKMLRSNKRSFDDVIITSYHSAEFSITEFSRLTRARVIYYIIDDPVKSLERENYLHNDYPVLLELATLKRKNQTFMEHADRFLCVSGSSEHYVARCSHNQNVVRLPYIALEPPVKPVHLNPCGDVIFIGPIDYRPNSDAIYWLADEILPELRRRIPGIKVHVIGGVMSEKILDLASDDLIFEEHQSDGEIERAFSSCSALINPMRISSGVTGSVLEAMARGIPVVSTSIGLELLDGLDYPSGNDVDAIVNITCRIRNEPAFAEDMVNKGREYVYRYASSDALESAFKRALN